VRHMQGLLEPADIGQTAVQDLDSRITIFCSSLVKFSLGIVHSPLAPGPGIRRENVRYPGTGDGNKRRRCA
jgi:hypothetical protein